MIKNKKGLSEVVTTIITILLVLVAIGIVWAVISNVLQSGTEQTENAAKCLQIDVKATAVTCDAAYCNVTYHRNSGGEEIDGVKVVLSNGLNSESLDIEGGVNGSIAELATVTVNVTITDGFVPNSAQVVPYFIDASGNQQVCSVTNTFSF